MDAMSKALAARRGKGIDLTIILGQPQAEKEKDGGDLAPAPEGVAHEDEAQDKELISEMMQKHEAAEGEPMDDEESMKQTLMMDHEGKPGAMEQGKKPKGLGDYVRMALSKKDPKVK